MGLTIHYNGKFNPAASLPEMIEEVKDIAEVNKWKYHIYETEFPKDSIGKESYNDKIYGIIVIPPNCEPVYLSFLSNGRMASEYGLQLWGSSKDKKEREYLYGLFTKTQYAGREIHKWIIHLFRYLKGKYFSEFNMFDEGKYWETNDEKLLDEIFRRYERALDTLSNALENIPKDRNESFEDYFNRILKEINDKNKK